MAVYLWYAHKNGKVVDAFNALDGDGAFSPERAGAVPVGAWLRCASAANTRKKEVYKKLVGNGGFNAYLGTNDARIVTQRANDGDAEAKWFWMHSIIRWQRTSDPWLVYWKAKLTRSF